MTTRPGQTFIGLKVSEELSSGVDAALKGRDKSQFVREAIAEKLKTMGIKLAEEAVNAPSRKGKGGPTKYKNQRRPRRKKEGKI